MQMLETARLEVEKANKRIADVETSILNVSQQLENLHKERKELTASLAEWQEVCTIWEAKEATKTKDEIRERLEKEFSPSV
ncbi:hypothetical protein ACIP5Z_01500 [Rothia terrae]|uniref:hypothetical protein n=1 Tax=Rothia terrae TaxID=396015 RepID=UPI00380F45C7